MAARRDLPEYLLDFLNGVGRFLLIAGGIAAAASLGLIVFTIIRMADPGAASQLADALRNVAIFKNVLLIGVVAASVGALYLYWGEELVAPVLLILAAAMYFAPLYFPSMIPNAGQNEAGSNAFQAMESAGIWLGVVAVIGIVGDVATRVRNRAKEGAKADNLKYGKNIKAESDRQNVFLGKCWQLPFCRKFVRERCPIYHAKTSCWKELVGCMCEEEVIKGAMENRPIPKDALTAGNMIPRNHKLTVLQKKERCKVCVIYNEHQRHKYRAAVPILVVSTIAIYGIFRGPLLAGMVGLVGQVNRVVYGFTYGASGKQEIPMLFTEMLLVVFFLVGLSYALKSLEFMIFKANL
jgi:hypothetical protein